MLSVQTTRTMVVSEKLPDYQGSNARCKFRKLGEDGLRSQQGRVSEDHLRPLGDGMQRSNVACIPLNE
jgi:hypothetical protein